MARPGGPRRRPAPRRSRAARRRDCRRRTPSRVRVLCRPQRVHARTRPRGPSQTSALGTAGMRVAATRDADDGEARRARRRATAASSPPGFRRPRSHLREIALLASAHSAPAAGRCVSRRRCHSQATGTRRRRRREQEENRHLRRDRDHDDDERISSKFAKRTRCPALMSLKLIGEPRHHSKPATAVIVMPATSPMSPSIW